MSTTRHHLPVEITAAPDQPLGMPPAQFLREVWQKRPLLIRGAFPGFASPISPDDLGGLACEEAALSRIVLHDPAHDRWTVRSGPFAEDDFANLPPTHWTLLVQDVEKWDAEVATILAHFAFLPRWRIDDVMVSYAEDGGGVGAHVDQYDVFLLQAIGRRRWRIGDRACEAGFAYRDDTELKLLREFHPTHDWMLEPGDMLYLPPGVPHEGTAVGACMTWSVGMRAPSEAELLVDLAESIAEQLPEHRRLADPDLEPPHWPGEIDEAAFARVEAALQRIGFSPSRITSANDAIDWRNWLGRFITRYRAAQEVLPRPKPITAATWKKHLEAGLVLMRNPWSRCAFRRTDSDAAEFFHAGEVCVLAMPLAAELCQDGPVEIPAPSPRDAETLRRLVNEGHFALIEAKRGLLRT